MARLACWSCDRQIYATAPVESLFMEERRCPRCGALMGADRREGERRERPRRLNPPADPGPPSVPGERRATERRTFQRRRAS